LGTKLLFYEDLLDVTYAVHVAADGFNFILLSILEEFSKLKAMLKVPWKNIYIPFQQ